MTEPAKRCIACGSTWVEGVRCLDCGRVAEPVRGVSEPRGTRTLPRTPVTPVEAGRTATEGRETATLPEPTDPQEEDWLTRKAAADRLGRCVHSGLSIVGCKRSDLCDCFDYPNEAA